jgi:hypothetical protein
MRNTVNTIIVSETIDQEFEIKTHLPFVWTVLRREGFDTGEIAMMFWKSFSVYEPELNINREFLTFGNTVLNSLMNEEWTFEEMMELVMEEWRSAEMNIEQGTLINE